MGVLEGHFVSFVSFHFDSHLHEGGGNLGGVDSLAEELTTSVEEGSGDDTDTGGSVWRRERRSGLE